TWNFLPFLLRRVGEAPAWVVRITFIVWGISIAAFAGTMWRLRRLLQRQIRLARPRNVVPQARLMGCLDPPQPMAYSSRKRHSALMSSERSKYLKFGGATVVILISLGFLAYTGVQESKSYYVTIKELRGLGDGAYTKRLRVAGNV